MPIKRFMIVDEIPENLYSSKGVLGEMRVSDVYPFESAKDALAAAEPKRVECVILSWDLKKMPSKVFIQKLRQVPNLAYIPLIVYSKRLKGEDVRLLNEIGGITVIPAPPDRSDLSQAIKKVIELDEKISPLEKQIRLCHALALGKRWKELEDALKVLAPEESAQGDVSYFRALIFFEQEHYKESQQKIKDCLKLKPQHREARQLEARISAKLGKHDEAIAMLVDLIDRVPEMLSILNQLGQVYKASDRLDEAKAIFQKIIKMDPTAQDAKDQLGEIAFAEGDYDLATEMLQDSENSIEMARNLNNIGIALTMKEDFERAVEGYTHAIRIFAKNKDVYLLYYNLGLAYKKKGDIASACEVFGQCVLLNPGFKKATAGFLNCLQVLEAKGLEPDAKWVKSVKKSIEEADAREKAS